MKPDRHEHFDEWIIWWLARGLIDIVLYGAFLAAVVYCVHKGWL